MQITHINPPLPTRERQHASQFSYFLQALAAHFTLPNLLTTAVSLITTLAKLPDTPGKMVGPVLFCLFLLWRC